MSGSLSFFDVHLKAAERRFVKVVKAGQRPDAATLETLVGGQERRFVECSEASGGGGQKWRRSRSQRCSRDGEKCRQGCYRRGQKRRQGCCRCRQDCGQAHGRARAGRPRDRAGDR